MQTHTDITATWSQAFEDGDVDTLLALYHPHALVEAPTGRWHGVDEIAEALEVLLRRKWRHHEVIASNHQPDRVAMITQHGPWLVEHVLQLVGPVIRAHRVRLTPLANE